MSIFDRIENMPNVILEGPAIKGYTGPPFLDNSKSLVANVPIVDDNFTYTNGNLVMTYWDNAGAKQTKTIPIGAASVSVDLSNYYTRSQITNLLTGYYTKTQVDSLLSMVNVDLSNYYTRTQVDALIPDLTNYYTRTQVDALIAGISGGGPDTLVDFISGGSDLNAYGQGGDKVYEGDVLFAQPAVANVPAGETLGRVVSVSYPGVSGQYNGGNRQLFISRTTGKVFQRDKTSTDLTIPTANDSAWQTIYTPPTATGGGTTLPAYLQSDVEVLHSRAGVLYWEAINQVPDAPGVQSDIGHVLTVTGTGDQSYMWRALPIAPWAMVGNPDPIPASKLTNVSGGGPAFTTFVAPDPVTGHYKGGY